VVAEGIESAEIMQSLMAMGCDEAQGYFIGRPMPADATLNWLQTAGWVNAIE
jgi:EAL domain-containing protein (putative c-di-GMP-specific phosphodiesterase class I)